MHVQPAAPNLQSVTRPTRRDPTSGSLAHRTDNLQQDFQHKKRETVNALTFKPDQSSGAGQRSAPLLLFLPPTSYRLGRVREKLRDAHP